MLYDIGVFSIILATVIGVISIMFSLPKIRGLKLIAILLISSVIMISIGTTLEVLNKPQAQREEKGISANE